jgi:hypothetical protein
MIGSKSLLGVVACGVVLGLSSLALAQGAGGGGGGGRGGFGGPITPTADTRVATIADMYLTGDLDLTADQKAKIKEIRATLNTARQPLKDLAKDMRDAVDDQDKMTELRAKAQGLQTAFKTASDQAIKDLKALFADDVQKKIDDRQKDLLADLRAGALGGGRGGAGGGRASGGRAGGGN